MTAESVVMLPADTRDINSGVAGEGEGKGRGEGEGEGRGEEKGESEGDAIVNCQVKADSKLLPAKSAAGRMENAFSAENEWSITVGGASTALPLVFTSAAGNVTTSERVVKSSKAIRANGMNFFLRAMQSPARIRL